ncbi:glycoside hydrolase family 127 protein [Acidobacteriota bacterium]
MKKKTQKIESISMIFFLVGLILSLSCAKRDSSQMDYPVRPVPFTAVKITDNFWKPRIETNRITSIPYAMEMNEETGRVDNLRIAAGLIDGTYKGRRFNDTDIYKVMEGAAYSLSVFPDPELEKQLDDLIAIIAAAQEEDGYLYAARTADPENPAPGAGPERWSRLKGSHELYNAGHMYEAAVAHFQATGKRSFLDIAVKNADLLVRTFGPAKRKDYPGHQEIEIGLAKLFTTTGKKDYIELAKFFLDRRGLPQDSGLYAEDTPFAIYNGDKYMQAHKPVLEQAEAVGHAVRASYMYAGMADVAALTGNPDYIQAIDRIWENVVSKKIYLTGGIGARHTSEAFGENYELPNESAYTETCAAIGNVLWNQRQFLLHGESKYIDVLERILYNGLISGVGLSGDCFFYQNPLASRGREQRKPWFEVACCPGSMTRFLPSLSGYIYAQRGLDAFINLFIQSTADLIFEGLPVKFEQTTEYPWDGKIRIIVTPESPMEMTVNIRIPGWAYGQPIPSDLYNYQGQTEGRIILTVNDEFVNPGLHDGYARLNRLWNPGDVIELLLPMEVRRVFAHEQVEADRNKVALERGPLVYALEGVDNDGRVLDLTLSDDAPLHSSVRNDLLGRIIVITGPALREPGERQESTLGTDWKFTAVPYYAWAHRGTGEMAVWVHRNEVNK